MSDWIAQALVYGDSYKDYVVGFYVVDPEAIQKFAQANSLPNDEALMENETLRNIVLKDVLRIAEMQKLNSLEKPKQFVLLRAPFSVENEILTSTMKMKRSFAYKYFEKEIKELYAKPPIDLKNIK